MTAANSATWALSSSLKRAQLQSIATSIGAPISGTKPQLLSGIHDLLKQTSTTLLPVRSAKNHDARTQSVRVLSIDMGIRNLAFAFLTCQMTTKPTGEDFRLGFTRPELRQWRKIELFQAGQALRSTEKDNEVDSVSTSIDEIEPQGHTTIDTTVTSTTLDESFEPLVLAKHAYTFAKYCAGLRPTHILVERQRFRTGGHAAVLEWSLRVGMLESMLHSTFHTFNREGVLPDVPVESILPLRVNKFWFDDQEKLLTDAYAEGILEEKGKQEAKLAKIMIVSEMLKKTKTKASPFAVHGDATATVDVFMSRSGHRSGLKKAKSSLDKLDDVADSLLQGLAWLKWQKNRAELMATSPLLETSTDSASVIKS